jgi:hypothetical protein
LAAKLTSAEEWGTRLLRELGPSEPVGKPKGTA